MDVSGDDEVVRVRGDRDQPLSRGYTCNKGRSLGNMHHHPDRLERPLMRVDGELRPVTWEECLGDLAARLRPIIDRYGPDSVGVFFGSGIGMDAAGFRLAEALYAALGTKARFSPLTIDSTAKVLVSSLVGGAAALNARPDYDEASFVIFLGTNPIVSHGHSAGIPNPKGKLRELRSRAEVWVIDPVVTESARAATHHVAPRPGTDYAIMAYLVREVLRDGADREVLARDTVDSEALAAAVEPFTLEHAARIADVPPAHLTRLLTGVRAAPRVAIGTGTGVTMAASANVTQWLSWALMIITGSMNRPGGVWFHPGFSYQLENVELPVVPPEGPFGPGPRSHPEVRSFLGEWPCAVLPDEIEAGNIRAVLNLGGHLLAAFPDASALAPALSNLEVFATLEIIGNSTTALSTHVLPSKDQLERADVTLWDFLSISLSAQHTPAVVEPVGDRRSTWWILAELGRLLGYELADTTGESATDDARLATFQANARRPYRELTDNGWARVPHELPAPWVERHVERLGGWRLAPRMLTEQLAGMAGQLASLREPAPLVLTPRRQQRHVNSQLTYLGDGPEILVHPEDAAPANVIDGQPVTVRNAQGELTGTAKVDPSLRRGTVSVPHGYEHANVNTLTCKDDFDPITGMADYSVLPVTIHPATPDEPPPHG